MKIYRVKAGVLCLTLMVAAFYAPRFTSQSRAQSEVRTYQSSGEAAKAFITLLSNLSDVLGNERRHYYSSSDEMLLDEQGNSNLFSSDNMKKLRRDGVWNFVLQLAADLKNSSWEIKSESKGSDNSTVTLAPNPHAPRDVVCVKEPAGWKVDVLATYALWNQLSKDEVEKITTRALENQRRASCQSNLKQIALGLLQYQQDYDEKLPPAKNWQDMIMPYVKSQQIFNCPSVESGEYGYAYNWRLSKYGLGKINDPAQMIELYETTNLKRNASGEGKDMAFRHMDGTNLAFVDGHVKWFAKDKLSPDSSLWSYIHFTLQPEKKINSNGLPR